MIESLENEKWRTLEFKNSHLLQKKYMISNLGRMASCINSLKKDGALLKGSMVEGYRILRMKVQDQYIHFLFHRAVAQYFLRAPKKNQTFIIHLNHNKKDNKASNLQWATQQEVAAHNLTNPRVKAAKKKAKENPSQRGKGIKLTLPQVIQIKKILLNPKRKLTHKQIAVKFGVSEMAITRMKRGENWGSVKV